MHIYLYFLCTNLLLFHVYLDLDAKLLKFQEAENTPNHVELIIDSFFYLCLFIILLLFITILCILVDFLVIQVQNHTNKFSFYLLILTLMSNYNVLYFLNANILMPFFLLF